MSEERDPRFPDHVTADEVAYVRRAIQMLQQDQPFRTIVRQFQSRVAQGQAIEPLKNGVLGELWKAIAHDAGLT